MTALSEFTKSIFLCVAMFFCHVISHSQADTSLYVTYGGIYEDGFTRVIYDSDSNLVYCGSSSSFNDYGRSGFMMKTDTLLNHIWTSSYQNDGYSEFRDMAVLNDHFVLTGRVLNEGSGYDVLVTAFDSSGELLWDKNLGTDDWDEGNSIEVVSDGILVTGSSYGNTLNSRDGVIYKLDLNGELIWTKYYDQGFNESINDGKESTGGNYIFGGEINETDELSKMWFLVTDSDGEIILENIWEEEGINYLTSVLADSETENYFMCGQIYNSQNESLDGYTCRLNEFGETMWADTIEWSGTQRWNSLEFGDSNELIISGVTEGGPAGGEGQDFLVKRLLANGVFLNQRTHGSQGNEESLTGIKISNGYVFAGATDGLGEGQEDGLIIRVRSSGSDENHTTQEISSELHFVYTSLNELGSNSNSLYFTDGVLYSSEIIKSVDLYSIDGKLLESYNTQFNSLKLDLVPGLYLLIVNKNQALRIAY